MAPSPEREKKSKRRKDPATPTNNRAGGSESGGDGGDGGGGGGAAGQKKKKGRGGGYPKIYWLNTTVTKLHNVRAEPIFSANIVGHLFADRQVRSKINVH